MFDSALCLKYFFILLFTIEFDFSGYKTVMASILYLSQQTLSQSMHCNDVPSVSKEEIAFFVDQNIHEMIIKHKYVQADCTNLEGFKSC